MDSAGNKIFITQSDQAAFLILKLKENPHIKITEQVVNGRLGWEIDATPETYELLREYEGNPLVRLKDFIEVARKNRVQIRLWQSLSRKPLNKVAL